MTSLAVLPLVMLLQFLPPPAGGFATAMLFQGVGGARGAIVAAPAPAAGAGVSDCHCGVPDSPRGPR